MGSIPDVSNNNNILRHTMGALRLYSLSTHTHIYIYLRIKSKGNVSLFPSSLCVAVSLGDEKEKKKRTSIDVSEHLLGSDRREIGWRNRRHRDRKPS